MRRETTYTIEQLEELSTVRARTVRDYVARGLLTGAVRPGPGAWHPESDLHRLLFIARLRRELGLSLGCIAELLGELGPEEIRRIGTGKERVSVLRLGGTVFPGGGSIPCSSSDNAKRDPVVKDPKSPRPASTRRDHTKLLQGLDAVPPRQLADAIAGAIGKLVGVPCEVLIESTDLRGFGSHRGPRIRLQLRERPSGQQELFSQAS